MCLDIKRRFPLILKKADRNVNRFQACPIFQGRNHTEAIAIVAFLNELLEWIVSQYILLVGFGKKKTNVSELFFTAAGWPPRVPADLFLTFKAI